MFAFLIRRILQTIIVMLVISFIGFSIKHNLGDPVRELYGESVSAVERAKLSAKLGLDKPFIVQYAVFLKKAVTKGDLGQSFFYKKPAVDVILTKAPATIELVICSALLVFIISIPSGIYSAIYPKKILSRIIMAASTVGVAIPVFLTAMVLVLIFSAYLGWLPAIGRGDNLVNIFGWHTGLLTWDGLSHLILPSIALSSITLPLFIRLIRSEMMEVLESEYIKFAKAKGLSTRRIFLLHAFKNTLLPVITVGGVQIGTMIAFTILTETVFQWPGMGFMFLDAVQRSDTSLLIAYLVFVGFLFVFVNTFVDIIYALVNPLVRVSGRK